jgi:hypothetical protein
MFVRCGRTLGVCGALVVSGPLVAWAAPPNGTSPQAEAASSDDELTKLRERGNTAMRSGRPADALDAYEGLYGKTHDPAMLYNMARAHQALTNYARAEDLLQQFKAEAPPQLLNKVTGVDRLLGELAARIHTLTVETVVEGAEVRIGGRVVGSTPLPRALRLNAGRADIEVRAEGFLPFRRSVELRGGETSTIEVVLARIDNSGIVFIRSRQAGAIVSIDGNTVGNVPLEMRLASGPHELRVTKEGFQPARSQVVVITGQRKEVDVDLAGTPSVLTRWWFWTGVGVVAAAGVGTYFALTTEKSAPIGSIPPGQVSLKLHY